MGLGVTIGEAVGEALASGEGEGDGENEENGDGETEGSIKFFSFKNTAGAQPAKGRSPKSLKKSRLSMDSRM